MIDNTRGISTGITQRALPTSIGEDKVVLRKSPTISTRYCYMATLAQRPLRDAFGLIPIPEKLLPVHETAEGPPCDKADHYSTDNIKSWMGKKRCEHDTLLSWNACLCEHPRFL